MRRVTLMVVVMAVMVSLFAAVAYAATIEGTNEGEELFESNLNDTIFGRGGADIIDAGGTFGEPNGDRDVVYGNRGNDDIRVDDGDARDTVNGGNGSDDRCLGDPGDELNCEVETPPGPGPLVR
jgi:hypothetical protein